MMINCVCWRSGLVFSLFIFSPFFVLWGPSWPFIFINFFCCVFILLFTSLSVDLQYRNEKTRKAAFLSYHFFFFVWIYQDAVQVLPLWSTRSNDRWPQWGNSAAELNIFNSLFGVNGILCFSEFFQNGEIIFIIYNKR